ncbi:formylglycine-generating enzyme family protein [Sorangium sp. So ce385]|uniref:formylglycine-generating enzyme family protein n=1 Tax=Sorangium sp. So ce385 TaxID=3133308 RepID=UPI003F5C85F1
MRERLAFLAALAVAALVSALLFAPRFQRRPEPLDLSSAAPPASVPPPEPAPPAPALAPPPPPPLPAYVRVNPASATACLGGMVLVDGIYCPYVGHHCASYIDEEKDICARFEPEVLCEGRLQHRRFCIDVFEYPNIEGVRPAVMVNWLEAKRACEIEGKRLCSGEEWEFACEGPQMWPYPYGIARDPEACNIDRKIAMPVLEVFGDPWKISAEVERLDRRVASGEMHRCVSPFGVRDMTGNVDEWVNNELGHLDEQPFRSTLKGGYWGPIRSRCRPVTSTHNRWFRFYQVGFRCCADALDGGKAVSPAAKTARIPRRSPMADPAGRQGP